MQKKILIYRYGSICETNVMDGFSKLGFDLKAAEHEIKDKEESISQKVERMSQIILDEIFWFVFSINFFPWLSDLCNVLRVPYFCWIVDSPVLELYSDSLGNECNRVFLFDYIQYKEFSLHNPNGVFHLPLAANLDRSRKVYEEAPGEKRKRYKAEVSFIGSTYTEKCPFNQIELPERERGFADGLIESQLKVYGYNFLEEALTDQFVQVFKECEPSHCILPPGYRQNERAVIAQHYLSVKVAEQERIRMLRLLSEHVMLDVYTGSDISEIPKANNRGLANSTFEVPLIFCESKINLNITAKSIRSGLSQRVFDVLGCGGFLLTNYQSEITDWFEPGVDLETYASEEELLDKVNYYLLHEDDRRQIAKNGYQKVRDQHTNEMRLMQMLEVGFSSRFEFS